MKKSNGVKFFAGFFADQILPLQADDMQGNLKW